MKKSLGIFFIIVGVIGPFTQKFDMATIIVSILFIVAGVFLIKTAPQKSNDPNKKLASTKQVSPKSKKGSKQTVQLVTTGKERQANLEQCGNMNLPMKAVLNITNQGNLYVSFGLIVQEKRSVFKEIGKLQPDLTKKIQQQYEKANGLSCNIDVLNYTISKDEKELYQCVVDIEIVPE